MPLQLYRGLSDDYLAIITGPASLAEQIGPEHGCSLLLLALAA